jgi:hypothetical protein
MSELGSEWSAQNLGIPSILYSHQKRLELAVINFYASKSREFFDKLISFVTVNNDHPYFKVLLQHLPQES